MEGLPIMTSISLSAIVTELSREGTRQAYVLVSDTEQKAAEMYALVKNRILAQKIPHTVIDFAQGLSHLPEPFLSSSVGSQASPSSSLLLLENTLSVSADQSEKLNQYIKKLTDPASNSILWYLSIYTLGLMSSNYSNRAIRAFTTITKVIPDA